MTVKGVIRLLKRAGKGEFRDVVYGIYMGLRKLDLGGVDVKDLNLPPERSIFYSNSGGPELKAVFKKLSVTDRDCVIDIGCGKGGAIITLSKLPFNRVDGVEIHNGLVVIAERNFRSMKICNSKIYCSDASDFKEFDDYNYIYMAHPFTSIVMNDVMRNMESSIQKKPRSMTIVYKHPICDSDIVASGMFERVATYDVCYPSPTKVFVYKNLIYNKPTN